MMKITIIVAAIVLIILIMLGSILYYLCGPAGVIVPLLIMGLIAYIIYSIGVKNIFMILAGLAAILIIKKVVCVIIDSWSAREIRRCFRYKYSKETIRDKRVHETKQEIKPRKDPGKKTNNCPNCGAQIVKGLCPYCNTRFV